MEAINRREGQIWIDHNSPHHIKYFAYGREYNINPMATYDFGEMGDTAYCGEVVKLDAPTSKVVKATFPDDIDKVLGVISVTSKRGSTPDTLAVTKTGYVIIDNPAEVFATDTDITLATTEMLQDQVVNKEALKKTNYYDKQSILGKPVYWFIGKVEKTSSGYTYINTEDKAGKLTLSTPALFQGNTQVEDSLNVAYDNLPQVGIVTGVKSGKDNKLTEITVHLNFSKFDTSLEWNWPRLHASSDGKDLDCGLIEGKIDAEGHNIDQPIIIRHGLFCSEKASKLEYRPRCFVSTIASPISQGHIDRNQEYSVDAAVCNNYITTGVSTDREENRQNCTTVLVRSPETLYYRISGRVNYKFDKQHA